MDEFNLRELIAGLGFTKVEIESVFYELEAYKSIPGTTLNKYLKRTLATVDERNRIDFLKGLIAGTAIRESVESVGIEGHPAP